MKLIIDIDEDRYKDVIESRKHHLLDSYAEAVAYGIPFDKLKERINLETIEMFLNAFKEMQIIDNRNEVSE